MKNSINKLVLVTKIEDYNDDGTLAGFEYCSETEIPINAVEQDENGPLDIPVKRYDETDVLAELVDARAMLHRVDEIDPSLIERHIGDDKCARIAKNAGYFVADDLNEAVADLESDGLVLDASWPANNGGNLYKNEALALVADVAYKHGWNTIYERLRDLDYMKP